MVALICAFLALRAPRLAGDVATRRAVLGAAALAPLAPNSPALAAAPSWVADYYSGGTFSEAFFDGFKNSTAVEKFCKGEGKNYIECTPRKGMRSYLSYKIYQPGEGKRPELGQEVFINYAGYTLDGKLVDAGSNFKFSYYAAKHDNCISTLDYCLERAVGKGKVIGGWEATVGGMQPGMRLAVVLPPQWAYGTEGFERAGDDEPGPGARGYDYEYSTSWKQVDKLTPWRPSGDIRDKKVGKGPTIVYFLELAELGKIGKPLDFS